MSDSLNNLEADRNFYEISLLKLQNELEVAKDNLIHGVNIRKGPPRYHKGMDVGSDPPSGFAYQKTYGMLLSLIYKIEYIMRMIILRD